MKLSKDASGRFSLTIESADLARGLRPSKRTPVNKGYLIECKGAVGRDKVLQALDQLTRLDTSVITDPFPFPQLLIDTQVILVCGLVKIYELVDGSLSDVTPAGVVAGSTWSWAPFADFVYISNGKVAITRDPLSKTYSVSATLPHATAICNFNGQVIIGSPDVDTVGVNLTVPAGTGAAIAAASGSI